MFEYIFSVGLIFLNYVPAVLIFAFLWWFIPKNPNYKAESIHWQNARNAVKYIGFAILVLGIFNSFISPSVTYKHETLDRSADVAQIKRINEEEIHASPKTIVDRSRQPTMTEDQRQESFKNTMDWSKPDYSNR